MLQKGSSSFDIIFPKKARSDLVAFGENRSRIILISQAGFIYLLYWLFCCTTLSSEILHTNYLVYAGEANPAKLALGFILCCLSACFVKAKGSAAKDLFLWLILLFIVAPKLLLAGLFDWGYEYPLGVVCVFCISSYIVSTLSPRTGNNGGLLDGELALWVTRMLLVLLFASVVAIVYWMLQHEMFPTLESFDFRATYDIRANVSFPKYIGYVVSFTCTRALPLALVFFLARKRYILALATSFCELVFFMSTANKSWLFIVVLVWVFALFGRLAKLTPANVGLFLIALLVVVWVVSLIPADFTVWPASLFVRRAIILPAALGHAWFDFSQSNPLVLLAGTPLNAFTPLPAEYSAETYSRAIGAIYYGGSNANNGLFGGEFMNFGPFAWFVIGFNVVLIGAVLSTASYNEEGNRFKCLMAIVIATKLIDATSINILFSYSGLLFFAIFFLMVKSFGKSGEGSASAAINPARSGKVV